MEFRPEAVTDFLQLFKERQAQIQTFDGCHAVQLLQDLHNEAIFFTHSYWESEAHLEQYRQSAFFKDTWQRTRALFAEKAAAWSVQEASLPV